MDIVFKLLDGDLTWDQIADQYGVSRSLLSVYRKASIKQVRKMLQIREEQKLEFLLN